MTTVKVLVLKCNVSEATPSSTEKHMITPQGQGGYSGKINTNGKTLFGVLLYYILRVQRL